MTIKECTVALHALYEEIAEMQSQMKRAREDREKENTDFRGGVDAVHCGTHKLVNVACSVSQVFDSDKAAADTSMEEQEPAGTLLPVGFEVLPQNNVRSGGIDPIQQIVSDANAIVAVASCSDKAAQLHQSGASSCEAERPVMSGTVRCVQGTWFDTEGRTTVMVVEAAIAPSYGNAHLPDTLTHHALQYEEGSHRDVPFTSVCQLHASGVTPVCDGGDSKSVVDAPLRPGEVADFLLLARDHTHSEASSSVPVMPALPAVLSFHLLLSEQLPQ